MPLTFLCQASHRSWRTLEWRRSSPSGRSGSRSSWLSVSPPSVTTAMYSRVLTPRSLQRPTRWSPPTRSLRTCPTPSRFSSYSMRSPTTRAAASFACSLHTSTTSVRTSGAFALCVADLTRSCTEGGMFADGLRVYLNLHKYGNAETQDLWEAIAEVSNKPIPAIMDSWVNQAVRSHQTLRECFIVYKCTPRVVCTVIVQPHD